MRNNNDTHVGNFASCIWEQTDWRRKQTEKSHYNHIDFPPPFICCFLQSHLDAQKRFQWLKSNSCRAERKSTPMRFHLQTKKKPPHRFFTGCPRSERKYFTALQLPARLRFIILYLIPFISSTFNRVIRLPVLHICLQLQIKEVMPATRSGFLLKQVYLVIAGIQTDRKVVFGAGEQAPD